MNETYTWFEKIVYKIGYVVGRISGYSIGWIRGFKDAHKNSK